MANENSVRFVADLDNISPEQINTARQINTLIGMHDLSMPEILTVLALVSSKHLQMSGKDIEDIDFNTVSFQHLVKFATSLDFNTEVH